jgi:hypothetical protein
VDHDISGRENFGGAFRFVAMRARKILLILATCGAAILGHKVTDAQSKLLPEGHAPVEL